MRLWPMLLWPLLPLALCLEAVPRRGPARPRIDVDAEVKRYRGAVPYMDIEYTVAAKGGKDTRVRRVRFELFWEDAPATAVNFAKLLAEPEGAPRFMGCPFHRIIPGFMMQGGDFTMQNGTGGRSVYGGEFEDETFVHGHKIGVLSMANHGKDTNSSQFFITFAPQPHLDGMHVVFGRVRDAESWGVVKEIEGVKIHSGSVPRDPVRIVGCGMEKGAESEAHDSGFEEEAHDSGFEEEALEESQSVL